MKRLWAYCLTLYQSVMTVPALLLSYPFVVLGLISHQAVGNITEPSLVVSRIPFSFGEKVRLFYYRALLHSVGRGVVFKYGSYCQYRNTSFGNRVLIGHFSAVGEVSIGDSVLIGANVNILSGLHQHTYADPNALIWDSPGPRRKKLTIGSDVWIGSNAVVGNDIGNRCVVAANAAVFKRVKNNSLVGGNPAGFLMTI